jgi:hypothetical protein
LLPKDLKKADSQDWQSVKLRAVSKCSVLYMDASDRRWAISLSSLDAQFFITPSRKLKMNCPPCLGTARRCFVKLLATSFLVACEGRQAPSEPVPWIESLAPPIESDGVRFQAQVLRDSPEAAAVSGFDMRGAGLLPLRIRIANQAGGAIKIIPRQTFLIDAGGQAWPLLTAQEASERLARAGIQAISPPRPPQQEDLGALTGFALDLVPGLDAAKMDKSVSQTLAAKAQHNRSIAPGQTGFGAMLFPGFEETLGVRGLRLAYEQGGYEKFLMLPLKPSAP